MNGVVQGAASHPPRVSRFCAAAAEDLALLSLLHDRELDRDLVLALWEHCSEAFLGVGLRSPRGREAERLFREGLAEIPAGRGRQAMDRLAADYADIYLTHALRVSPCESVWLTEEGLTMQEPMFRVRAWYQRHGLAVADWRRRTDDHLVCQLRFLAHLFRQDAGEETLADAARFLDEHLLCWIDAFAQRVSTRCATPFYAGLALLTAAWLDEVRDLLAEVLDEPRPSAQEVAARRAAQRSEPVEVPGPWVPGAAPGW